MEGRGLRSAPLPPLWRLWGTPLYSASLLPPGDAEAPDGSVGGRMNALLLEIALDMEARPQTVAVASAPPGTDNTVFRRQMPMRLMLTSLPWAVCTVGARAI